MREPDGGGGDGGAMEVADAEGGGADGAAGGPAAGDGAGSAAEAGVAPEEEPPAPMET